ncbi:beta-galactosidase [Saccharothrix sp. NRRL B-16348]|uniref:beta-galactosidase n=1 Tax=Saccharothrix sp. NRRL B-16348 TaxID=1415542 RepID=UPI0006ADCFD2|nr:beta-galactosidase [Saccharothrix sp. NRRL B-16348]KOX16065.1 beta-galactosidase [Saccharothrix sp. NRRL B-16348]
MTTWPTGVRGLAWGADYNPEQWPEDVWAEDVELMRRAGVNLVSVGIFSWALLEVEDGRYEFGRLDRVLDLLHDGGIRVDLATPTAALPPWLTAAHPEVLPETVDGIRLSPGSRQSYCPSSPVYRAKAVALVRALAERYRDHPALAAWHVHNEYGCHVQRCYCDRSAVAFRDWLKVRHGTLDVLNEAWATTFWSQRYTSWEQVLPPRMSPSQVNPGLELDFDRFSSDALLELFKAERDVLREVTPGVPVTTNFMATSGFQALDYWKWAAEVDFVSNDHYTHGEDPERHVGLAFSADLVRGLAGGRPWLLMEHSTSAVAWQHRNIAKLPGELRRNSYAHVAHGADGTLFFQWRQSRAGAERYHSAMVPHAGPDTKVYREVEQVGAEYQRIAELVGSTVRASVAIVHDWQSVWAVSQPSHPTKDFDHPRHVLAHYRALWRAGVTVDFVPPGADLSGYRLVVLPALYLVDDASPYERYVEAGGRLLVTFLSGISDSRGHVHLGGYPGAFRDLLGVRTEEFHPLREAEQVSLDDGSTAAVWTEHLHATTAQVLASYVDGPLPGVPAVTRNDGGTGVAWYVACGLTGDGLDRLTATVLADAGVTGTGSATVEVVRRRGEVAGSAASWLVAINHGESDAELPAVGVELLSGERVAGRLVVPPGHVVVVREEP